MDNMDPVIPIYQFKIQEIVHFLLGRTTTFSHNFFTVPNCETVKIVGAKICATVHHQAWDNVR